MYTLFQTDRAGNTSVLAHSNDFQTIHSCARGLNNSSSQYTYQITNPDRVGIDCPDGLTEAERELVPM